MHGIGRRVYQFFISSKRWDCGPKEVSIYTKGQRSRVYLNLQTPTSGLK